MVSRSPMQLHGGRQRAIVSCDRDEARYDSAMIPGVTQPVTRTRI